MKLTYYTSFNDLKTSKNSIHTKQSDSVKEFELKEFINLVKENHLSKKPSKIANSSNQATDGK
jgi:hypothetical protein